MPRVNPIYQADGIARWRRACEHCHEDGVIFMHADDCDDDLCALNGDMHSCVGQLVPCDCPAGEAFRKDSAKRERT